MLAGDSGSDRGEWVIRRAAQLAREADAELLVVHVDHTRPRRPNPRVVSHRALTEELGGLYHEVVGDEVPDELARIAASRKATIVVGGHRSRLRDLLHGSVSARLRRRVGDLAIEEVRKAPTRFPTEEEESIDGEGSDAGVEAELWSETS